MTGKGHVPPSILPRVNGDMTRGGPGSSSTTFAIWAYQLGFGSTLPDFSPAAAVGNLLIVIAVVFGLIYIRVQRRMDLS